MNHPAATDGLRPEQLIALRDRLAAYCGVYLDDARLPALRIALLHRAADTGCAPAALATLLQRTSAQAELQQLAELVLNHETLFFRNRQHMQALREVIIPEWHRRLPPGVPLRLWSAGCATGEEPYSMAIIALEALGSPLPRPVEIWATDLSTAALAHARGGSYRGRTLGHLSPTQRVRYFNARGHSLTVNEQVRRLVRFEQQNLLDPFPSAARGMHVIFCQNVTIYFQVATCRALMGRFYETLAEGGSLLLGFSETLWNIFDRFRWREVADAYVYYKESQVLRSERPATAPLSLDRPQAAAPARPMRPAPSQFTSPEVVARGRALLDAGEVEAALRLFHTTPLAGGHAPQLLALTAQAHANRGDLDLAVAEAHRALELNPLTIDAYILLGQIYARQGQPLDAIRQLDRARYLDSESPLIAFHLAECYHQVGRTESALREYRNTLRHLSPHPPNLLIGGVAVGWLRETCQRYVTQLRGE